MKQSILKVLLENTDTEGRYIGGGDEPIIVMFKNSEDCNRENFLSQIADEIVNAVNINTFSNKVEGDEKTNKTRELKTIKEYTEFTHNEGSRYERTDYDDDGYHMTYTERDKNGHHHFHKVNIRDRNGWDELCRLYPN